jgi:hypothetical protein
VNCPDCQRLTNECRRLDDALVVAQKALDVARPGSFERYEDTRIVASDAGIDSRLAHAELDLHILRQHPNAPTA